MKIRTQFYLLIIAIILIPIFVFFSIALVNYYREPERALVPGYQDSGLLSESDITKSDWDKIKKFVERMPPSLEFLVINKESKVLFSSIPTIKEGQVILDSQILDMIRESGYKYFYQLDIPSKVKSKDFLVLTRIPREIRKKPQGHLNVFTVLVVLLSGLLLLCAIVLTFIAKGITKSVTVLEESTKRLAEGNLEVPIDVKGSNEITSLTESLNRMRLSLKEENTRRSRFIMGVSHDLRTPIALIKGYTEAINDGMTEDPEMMKKSLGIIIEKSNQLDEMVDDLINFIKLDTGEWRQKLVSHNLFNFLSDYCKQLTLDATLLKRTINIEINLPEDTEILFDERLFYRALENLTGNALRYTDENGTITFESHLDYTNTDKILISITDNGKGITQTDLPFIFDVFYRGSNSRREEGKGLGLSVVKSVINSHGWDIDVESTENVGSSFIITIPVNQDH